MADRTCEMVRHFFETNRSRLTQRVVQSERRQSRSATTCQGIEEKQQTAHRPSHSEETEFRRIQSETLKHTRHPSERLRKSSRTGNLLRSDQNLHCACFIRV
ncbi:hypothetical protein L596_007885 [Steinernema carpocapsae]|uniref:Uncharacterized protein n=1 Tax=Steinernema carpocapsae TaxID=34508 RepID=A0A4V6A649_STECR|nr:hypothetical protein L596_007885 [Steinernema carpocapsae]